MNRCPISYDEVPVGRYSSRGLKLLSPKLQVLEEFPYSVQEQVRESAIRASKISIQGVQPKLSARFNSNLQTFEVVDTKGRFILKPQNPAFPELPENEDLTMRMAKRAGLNVPFHGMVYCCDGSLTYFIKRFDRATHDRKLQLEDFAQLAQLDRDNKYRSSTEKVVELLDYCTFPAVERLYLLRLTLFNFLVGNEDMHLKNFSILREGNKVSMSPAYDLLSSTLTYLSLGKSLKDIEEFALPLAGKKKKISRELLIDYLAYDRMGLNQKVVAKTLDNLKSCYGDWLHLIDISFLSDASKTLYKTLLNERFERLFG